MWLLRMVAQKPQKENEWVWERVVERAFTSPISGILGAEEYNFSIEKKFMMFYPEYFVIESTFFNDFCHTLFVEGIKGINQGYDMCLH